MLCISSRVSSVVDEAGRGAYAFLRTIRVEPIELRRVPWRLSSCRCVVGHLHLFQERLPFTTRPPSLPCKQGGLDVACTSSGSFSVVRTVKKRLLPVGLPDVVRGRSARPTSRAAASARFFERHRLAASAVASSGLFARANRSRRSRFRIVILVRRADRCVLLASGSP